MGVVHPLHLSDAQRSAWGQIFGDYEIIPPFPQLGRAIHRLDPEEVKAKEIVRNEGFKVPAISLVGTLERDGWTRGSTELGGGGYCEHSKPFEAADVTAVIQYDGVWIGHERESEDQEVQRCFFFQGIYNPTKGHPRGKERIPLRKIDSVVISEVLGTLAEIASKRK